MSSNTDNRNSSPTAGVDTTPLLSDHASRFHSRAMSEPSMRVREARAEQIEARQSEWRYSKPIEILHIVLDLVVVIGSISVLITSRHESLSLLFRTWIVGYGLLCLRSVYAEYRKRCEKRNLDGSERSVIDGVEFVKYFSDRMQSDDEIRYSKPIVILYIVLDLVTVIGSISVLITSRYESPSVRFRTWIVGNALLYLIHMVGIYVEYRKRCEKRNLEGNERSFAKILVQASTMFYMPWLFIGSTLLAGGQSLISESPQLYWFCYTYFAFYMWLASIFFIVVAVLYGVGHCLCLLGFIIISFGALLSRIATSSAVAYQEGATTKEDIEKLPRYTFHKKQNGEIQESFGGVMTKRNTDSPIECVLTLEDAECSICLCSYEDGTELRELQCWHHFHSACIDKWLHINATCPICMFNQSGSVKKYNQATN